MSIKQRRGNTDIRSQVSHGEREVGLTVTAIADPNRRKVMKVAGVLGGAAIVAGSPLMGFAADLVAPDNAAAAETGLTSESAGPELLLQIVSSNAVTEDSVLLTNNTAETLKIDVFRAGHVVFGQRVLDLNQLIQAQPLELAASRTVSFKVVAVPLYDQEELMEYVWAEESKFQLTEDAMVVSLGAFMVADDAIVFTRPEQLIAQQVTSGIPA